MINFYVKFDYEISKNQKKKNSRNSRNAKINRFFCSLKSLLFFKAPGIPPLLKVFSTSCSIEQCQLFWSTNSPWILEGFCASLNFLLTIKFGLIKNRFLAIWQTALEELKRYVLPSYRWTPLAQQAGKYSLGILSQIAHSYDNRLCIT